MNPTTVTLIVLTVVCFGCMIAILNAERTRRRVTERLNSESRRKTLERKRELLRDFLAAGYLDKLFQGGLGLSLEQREQIATELGDWVAGSGSYFANAPHRIHDDLVTLANYAAALALPDQRVQETVFNTGLWDR